MPEHSTLTVHVNGRIAVVPAGSVVSAAMLAAGEPCRTSVSGAPRTALCGMGICFECRAVVDGVAHQRTCQMLCREGMKVETQR
jgi:sarcosine oxidase subunit alpha